MNNGKMNMETEIKLPDWVDLNVWCDFTTYRKQIKKPMTLRAKELLISKLEGMKENGDNPNEVLEQSIMNGWQGIFPLKKDARKKTIDPDKYIKGKYGHMVQR